MRGLLRLRPRAVAWTLAVLLVVSWLAPAVGLLPSSPALGANTDLTLVTDTVYTVQPEHNRVRVTMTVVARNNTHESRTKKFFFDHAFLAVQPAPSDLRISGSKGARVRTVKHNAASTLLRIDFGSRLYSGRSRTFKVSFDLVDRGTPADRQIRVGSSLVTLPVWAHASTGARGSTVRVRFPAGYDVAVETGAFDHRTTLAGGGTELSTGSLSNPLAFFAYVTAQRTPVYADTALTVTTPNGPVALTLRGWEDDPAWAKRVDGLLTRGLPVLTEDIGLPWPNATPMVVQEAANQITGGYEGLFDPAANRVEVAYWADHLLVLHEAAHGWFNGRLLADRWASEGFASLYALRAASAIKEQAAAPLVTEKLAASAIPLNAWAAQTGSGAVGSPDGEAVDRATESYGYAASHVLAAAIAARAGDDALRAVWTDAAAGIGAYQPVAASGAAASGADASAAGDPELVAGPPDWRGLLDLLESRTGKDFSDLWRQWVVRPDEAALLDARAQARLSYERTLALADGWALPRSIRDALRAWQFDDAERLMADARTVFAQRGALVSMAAQRELTLPADMRTRFEAGQLAEASARAEAERNAMLVIGQAAGERTNERDLLTTIGMIGEDPEAKIASASASLAAGDLDATLASANDAFRAWNGAWQEGRRRGLLALAVLATIVVLASAVVGRVRKARGPRPASVAAGSPGRAAAESAGALALAESDADREPTVEELLAAATPPLPGIDQGS